MTDVKVGQLYEAKDNYRFKILCIDDGCCFVKWLDEENTHGVLSEEAVRENCKPFTMIADQTDPQPKPCRECDDYAGDGMYCAKNHLVYDFDTCKDEPQTDCAWK